MKEKKVKFNVIDAIVLIVIIAAVAVVCYKMFGEQSTGRDEGTYTMKFLCEEVPEFAASIIEVGDKVVDEQKDVPLGTVEEVVLDDSITYTTDSNGEIYIKSKPRYNSVELTTTLTAGDYDNGIIVDSSKYGVGHSITIRVGKAKIFGRISYIEKNDDTQE